MLTLFLNLLPVSASRLEPCSLRDAFGTDTTETLTSCTCPVGKKMSQLRTLWSPWRTFSWRCSHLFNVSTKTLRIEEPSAYPVSPMQSKAMPNEEDACLETSQSQSGRSASTLPSSAILRPRKSSATTMKLSLAESPALQSGRLSPSWARRKSLSPCLGQKYENALGADKWCWLSVC